MASGFGQTPGSGAIYSSQSVNNMDVATLSSIVASAVQQTLQQQQGPSATSTLSATGSGPSTGHVVTAHATLSDRLTTGRSQSRRRLPSYIIGTQNKIAAKPAKVTTYTKTIICLPQSFRGFGKSIPIPRGTQRTSLAERGLIGKVCLTSQMSQTEIFAEIRSVFADVMNNETDFPFKFLQGTGKGCKSLTCPSLSSKFQWDAKQVNSLGEKSIYVLAEKELTLREEEFIKVESSGDSSDENRNPKRRRNSSPPLPPSGLLLHQVGRSNTPHQDGAVRVHDQQNTNTASTSYTQLSQEYREYCLLMENEKIDDEIDSEEEQEVQEAIMHSFGTVKSVGKQDLETFKIILDSHRRREISQAVDDDFEPVVFSRIHVLRSDLWKSALKCFRRASFDVSKPIKVVFVGEPSEDQGGPLREFFTLAMREMVTTSGLFEGAPENVALAHNALALQRKDYEIVGRMIAASICHGGPAPHSFSPVLAEMIVFGEVKSDVSINDIPDVYVRESLKKVDECINDEAMKKLMLSEEFNFRFDCGYTKANVAVADKEELFRTIALHYLVYRVHGEIEQIKKGMRETLQFGRLMDVYCDIIYSLLTPMKCPLSTTQLQDLFKPNFSEAGSNNKALEDKVVYFFMEYIKDSEENQTCVKLEDILMFVTGARVEPPIGFDIKLVISFTNEERLPATNTCGLSITLYRKYKDYAHFKDRMDFAVRNSHGFGRI